MDTYKLKVKIGVHEFEAEGSQEAVERQFEVFKELISSVPAHKTESTITANTGTAAPPAAITKSSSFDKIFKVNGRVVSLTALPDTVENAALLLLLGQAIYRENHTATASEIIDGLELSGHRVDRIDRLMEDFISDGIVLRSGQRKGTRYRLTNQGLAKAQALATDVRNTVP